MPNEELKEEKLKEEPIVKVGEIQQEPTSVPLPVKMLEEIEGNFTIMSSVPTHTPRTLKESIVFYVSGTTYRIYWFVKDAWKKVYDSAITARAYVELAPLVVSKSQTSINNWEDWNLSSSIPANAYAVEVQVYHDTNEDAGVRQNGSSNQRLVGNPLGYTTFTTLLDSDRIIDTYQSTTNLRFFVTGYWI